MFSVIECGENIGSLKNLFLDQHQAILFVKKLIDWSENEYEHIEPFQWCCHNKKEYIKIEVAA